MSTRRKIVVFRASGQAYGLPLEEIQEIIPLAELSRPPAAPQLLAGFLNVEGELVAVIRLSHLFGLPPDEPGLYTPLLQLRRGQPPLALLVDRVEQLAEFDESLASVPAGHSFNDCAIGLLTLDEGSVMLLDVERLLLARERQFLTELWRMEGQRLGAG